MSISRLVSKVVGPGVKPALLMEHVRSDRVLPCSPVIPLHIIDCKR